jgi:hypothetical protein
MHFRGGADGSRGEGKKMHVRSQVFVLHVLLCLHGAGLQALQGVSEILNNST